MKYLLPILLVFSSGSVFAFSSDCQSNNAMFAFRDGNLIEASSGDPIEMKTSQLVDIISTSTENCFLVGKTLMDVETITTLIEVQHEYMATPQSTQLVCSSVRLEIAKNCGE